MHESDWVVKTSPGIMAGTALRSADRLVDGHELGAAGEGGLTLMSWDHLGDAVHHIGAGRHRAAFAHELRNGLAVACAFHHCGADQGHGLGVDWSFSPWPCGARASQGGGENQQNVFFRGESVPYRFASTSDRAAGQGRPNAGRFHGAPSCNCRAAFRGCRGGTGWRRRDHAVHSAPAGVHQGGVLRHVGAQGEVGCMAGGSERAASRS